MVKEWQETPVEAISVDIYEPFYVKATMKNKIKNWPTIALETVGNTVTFEVIEGPTDIDKPTRIEDQQEAGWTETYIWKVRPTNNTYVGGYTPLKIYVQFDIVEQKEYQMEPNYITESFELNVIRPYINNEIWGGYQENSNSSLGQNGQNKDNMPGFELIVFILSISIVYLMFRKKKI